MDAYVENVQNMPYDGVESEVVVGEHDNEMDGEDMEEEDKKRPTIINSCFKKLRNHLQNPPTHYNNTVGDFLGNIHKDGGLEEPMLSMNSISLNYINKYVEQQMNKQEHINDLCSDNHINNSDDTHDNNISNSNGDDCNHSNNNNHLSNNQTPDKYGKNEDVEVDKVKLESTSFAIFNNNKMDSNHNIGNLNNFNNSTSVPREDDSSACLVCGDRGSGYHYTAFTCEGCKGFFKRSVQKNISYNCKDTENCRINKSTRNNCQFCRFQKCLHIGMKKEGVREDRMPGGRQKNFKRARMEAPADPLETFIDLLVAARPDLMPCIKDLPTDSVVDGSSLLEVANLMHFGYIELRLTIEWARKVPGFGDLLLEDQIALLKSSFMELNVLRLAFRSLNSNGCVKFTEDIEIPLEKCFDMRLGRQLIRLTLEFIGRLKCTKIDHSEFAILNAVVLTYPDATNVTDKQSVISLQTKLLDCLQYYTSTRYPDEPRRYGRLLLRLPLLRTISAHAAEMFLSLSLEGNVKVNALVLEMMDKM